ncbi:sensor histidine kinase, partial [Streptomyces clavuligerus]
MAQGRLRIYLGAAPGVGKTYAMLAEGRRLAAEGADVVVALVEPHGRRLTAAMAEGLPSVPRRRVVHRGVRLTEMDVAAVLARRPGIALVDELAHTTVPGSRNPRRWQDVEELLDAGIDVITTLNIQHLESLNDVVEEITGVRQHETLPDPVARRADQIELVDLEPEALRRRMTHGDIYPPDRIETALTHYFRVGNLTALRELALLWLADRVEEGLQRYRAEHGISAPWETRERILVGLTGGREGGTVIRRAARISARTPGSELLALHVVPGDGLADPVPLAEQRALVESLGGTYHQVTGDDIAAALLGFARTENVTQIVLGASRRGRVMSVVRTGVGRRTIRGSGPIDVHIVTHEEAGGPVPRPGSGSGRAPGPGRHRWSPYRDRRWWAALALAAVLPPALALVLTAPGTGVGPAGALLLCLLLVVVIALVGGLWPALLAAVVSAVLADRWFAAPGRSLSGARADELLAPAVFLAVAVLVGLAAGTAARRARRAGRAAAEAAALSRLATEMMRGRELPALVEQIRENFGLTSLSLLLRETAAGVRTRWYVVAAAGERPPERPEDADVEALADSGLTLAGRGRALGTDDYRVFAACGAQLAVAYSRGVLARRAAETDTRATAERTRASLLLRAGRELRAVLRTADEALVRLGHGAGTRADEARLLGTAQLSVRRAERLVADLETLNRLHGGALATVLRPVDVGEVLTASLDELGPGGRTVEVSVPDGLPEVIADAAQLARALTALIADALRNSAPGAPPSVVARALPGKLAVRVTDGGSPAPPAGDRPPGARAEGIAQRLSRELTEAMGGALTAAGTRGGRFTVTLTLPAVAPPA